MERDYSDKGVSFFYVYKALAHPEWDGYVTPYTLEERLMHVHEAQRTLGSRINWLSDTMDNELKHAMGSAPNSEWVVDENNVIVRRRDWSNPEQLRADLEELVGPVENPTTVADLDMPAQPPPQAAASGVVPRIDKPRRMAPLVTRPADETETPYYAKLRAEVDRGVLEEGEGKLYLRFMLDPLYHVHWNNQTPPIAVRVETPEGVTVSESVLRGPEVEAESDIDPREFLVDIKGVEQGQSLMVTAAYYACSDEQGWCRPVNQRYEVVLERNRDGGSVIPGMMARNAPPEMARRKLGDGKPDTKGPGVGAMAKAVGEWEMAISFSGQEMLATLRLRVEDGQLVGEWGAQGNMSELDDVSLKGNTLSFSRTMRGGAGPGMQFTGTIEGDAIKGAFETPRGEMPVTGERRAMADKGA